MQIIQHKNSDLTICQRFFIEKSLELLYMGSIDSYRVRFHNPLSILEELKYCLQEFKAGRIKHFQTIKGKERKAIIDEVLKLMDYSPNYLIFNSISKNYLTILLKSADEHNYKKLISVIEILLTENSGYLDSVLLGLEELISTNISTLEALEKIDTSLDILLSELIRMGFSKGFLYKLVYGIFVNSLTNERNFVEHFENFKLRVTSLPSNYIVIFRIDTTPKVYESISAFSGPELELVDNIDRISLIGQSSGELSKFNISNPSRKFIKCNISDTDYLSALKTARSILSEYLDVINLGLSDEYSQIHNRALVIDSRSPEKGNFQNNVNILDGKYRVEKDHYLDFTKKLPAILYGETVHSETKEKLKSAIRYLRLGNQSTEVEHKFINYWIGLEYLFSNYESQNTINRIKEHFINAHALAYVKRNVFTFLGDFNQIGNDEKMLVPSYTPADYSCLEDKSFYEEIGLHLLGSFPIMSYRAQRLKKWFFKPGKAPSAADYILKHRSNLEIHFTRIYRLRNEIIHDAATNTNNEHITSNLRYYLTFILNELIDFFSNRLDKKISIEDFFILNEIEIGNIEHSGYQLKDLLSVECSLDFLS